MMTQYPETRNAEPGEVGMVVATLGIKHKCYDGKNLRLDVSPCCQHKGKKNTGAFSICQDTGMWRCFNGACDKTGNWITFARMVGHVLSDANKYVRRDIVNFTDEWSKVMEKRKRTPLTSGKYPQLLQYCNDRGISNATLDAFRVVSFGANTVEIPIFAWQDDRWQRVSSRCVGVLDKDKGEQRFGLSGGPTHLLMGNHLLDLEDEHKRAFIFEGQWDMMTAYELGLRNVFSLPNGSTHVACAGMLQYIPTDWEIFVCMDMDDAGHKAATKFFCQIGGEKFRRLRLPVKDLNDWLKEWPELTKEEVLETACGLGMEDVGKEPEIEGIDFMSGDIEEEQPLVDTPWPDVNKFIHGGFFEGQITTLLAPSGSGKTTIVNHLAMHIAEQEIKCGLISLEDTESRLKKKLRMVAHGMKATSAVVKHLVATQLNGQETTHTDLVQRVEQMVRSDFKFIIVDNVNHIGGSIAEQLQTFRNVMNVVKGKACHCILVVQPKKLDGKQMVVNSGDMKGFSDILQGVWNHMNLCKTEKNDLVRYIHVEKCRDGWPGSKANAYMAYSHAHNFYTPIAEEDIEDGAYQGLTLVNPDLKQAKTVDSST